MADKKEIIESVYQGTITSIIGLGISYAVKMFKIKPPTFNNPDAQDVGKIVIIGIVSDMTKDYAIKMKWIPPTLNI